MGMENDALQNKMIDVFGYPFYYKDAPEVFREKVWPLRINDMDAPFFAYEIEHVIRHDEKERSLIKEWVDYKLMPYMTRKSINFNHTSYGLKHDAEDEIGFYVSNGDIKFELLLRQVPGTTGDWGGPNMMYPLSERFYKDPARARKWRCKGATAANDGGHA